MGYIKQMILGYNVFSCSNDGLCLVYRMETVAQKLSSIASSSLYSPLGK